MSVSMAGASIRLNSGADMPVLGMGIGTKNDLTKDGILAAIEIGYRAFDTARSYDTELMLGEALAKAFKERLVRREDVFVTTKLSPKDTHPADVIAALHTSLSDLQLDYVDLFLVHWPVRASKTTEWHNLKPGDFHAIEQRELWRAMESCVDAGLAKAIGVSNWSVKKLQELLLDARIPPAVNQVEVHPLWRQDKLREYCSQRGVVITGYSVLGAPANNYGSYHVITNPTITEIAQRNNKTPAQVILRWLMERGMNFTVRSFNRGRLEENFRFLDCTLSAADLDKLDSISEQKKVGTGEWLVQPEHGPFKTLQDVWDE